MWPTVLLGPPRVLVGVDQDETRVGWQVYTSAHTRPHTHRRAHSGASSRGLFADWHQLSGGRQPSCNMEPAHSIWFQVRSSASRAGDSARARWLRLGRLGRGCRTNRAAAAAVGLQWRTRRRLAGLCERVCGARRQSEAPHCARVGLPALCGPKRAERAPGGRSQVNLCGSLAGQQLTGAAGGIVLKRRAACVFLGVVALRDYCLSARKNKRTSGLAGWRTGERRTSGSELLISFRENFWGLVWPKKIAAHRAAELGGPEASQK